MVSTARQDDGPMAETRVKPRPNVDSPGTDLERAREATEVLLICMPFATLAYPSLALSLMKPASEA